MAKIEVTLLDRLMIPNVLKKEGNYSQMIINKDIRKKCELTQKELKDFDVKSYGPQIMWNEKGAKAKFNIDFTDLEKKEIVDSLKKLDEEKKITEDMVGIYKLFVG